MLTTSFQFRQEVVSPPGNSNQIHTSRPSPSRSFPKIYDETTPPNEPVVLQSSRHEPKPRTSPLNDKTLLQESPLASRPYLSDKSNLQDARAHQSFPSSQSEEMFSKRDISVMTRDTRDYRRRDYDVTRQGPPSVDNHDASLPRHQRHHSEPVAGRGSVDPSRLQPAEKPQVTNSKPTEYSDPKPQHGTGSEELRAEEKGGKVAFRTPVIDATLTDDRRRAADSRPGMNAADQDFGKQKPQQAQKQDANSVSTLVFHYERMEDSARLGGNIVRPGTAVPRSSTNRSTPLEAGQTKVVSPINHSQSISILQIDRPNTAIGMRPSVSSAAQSQARHAPPAPPIDLTSKLELISFPGLSLKIIRH
jgi:hypothetical protein